MLKHVAVIDECDILSQRLDSENSIRKALVPVYRDLLQFYVAALDIISSNYYALKLLCNEVKQKLPSIVNDFVNHVDLLSRSIENATLELVTDIKKLLQDNKGSNIDKERSNYHNERRDNHAGTACEWILKEPKFLTWLSEPASSQLILFGVLGSGKTVVAVYAIEELIRISKHQIPRSYICFHYCHHDERGTARYILRSLIMQLLDHQDCLKVKFIKWYQKLHDIGRTSPTESFVDLGNFLTSCVEDLDRILYIVIDGLDECDDESQHQLTMLLNTLMKKALKLKVFLTSRNNEALSRSLKDSMTIDWKPSEHRDAILVDYHVKARLRDSKPEFQSITKAKILEMAQGSAIWIQLTIELIQKQRIGAVGPLKNFLKEIPSPVELSQLYRRLFVHQTRNDEGNIALASGALETLAVTRRPLSILELGWVMALRDPSVNVRTIEALEEYVDAERVLDLLQPFLLTFDRQDKKKRQLELVHKSLKGTIQEQSPSNWQSSLDGQATQCKEIDPKRPLELETVLLHACVKYLLLDDIDQKNMFNEEQISALAVGQVLGHGFFDDDDEEKEEEIDSAIHKGPCKEDTIREEMYYDPSERGLGEFFVYASCNWLEHYKMSSQELAPKARDIIQLCRAGSKRLENWLGQRCRPSCTIEISCVYTDERPPGGVMASECTHSMYYRDALIITALEGPEHALEKLVEGDSIDLHAKDFREDTVEETIEGILKFGDMSRLSILFQASRLASEIRRDRTLFQMIRAWPLSAKRPEQWSRYFNLLLDVCGDLLIKESWANEILCSAASRGCLPAVEKLFEEAARNPAMRATLLQDTRQCNTPNLPVPYHQSVGEAAWCNEVTILRYLLQQDGIAIHLKHVDSKGNNVLHKAVRSCNPEVFELLISHFPEGVNQRNANDDTPLDVIMFNCTTSNDRVLESVKILLQKGRATVERGPEHEWGIENKPIRKAARNKNAEMCRLLVEIGGANPRDALKFVDGRPTLIDSYILNDERGAKVQDTLCSLAGIV